MGTSTAPSMLLRSQLKPSSSIDHKQSSLFLCRGRPKKKYSVSPVMRLFGPAVLEASKLRVLVFGVDEKKQPGYLLSTHNLTYSDITAKLTLAISQTINNSQLQGLNNNLYRDEVGVEWKKVKGKMSLHVHYHIGGGHFLSDFCAKLRHYIFWKELPSVLKAFIHGNEDLFKSYPDLQETLVWVYFHSDIAELNRVQRWGSLKKAVACWCPPEQEEQQ